MAAGTLVSRFLGFGKTWMLAAALGLGSTVTDTFINANNLPNLIFLLVAGGVFNAVLVPQIIKASKAPDRGADYISRLLTLAVVVLLSLTAAGDARWRRWVIDLTTQGYSPQQKSLAVAFAFWCLPQIFFYGLYALLTQVLNANGAFGPAMWAPILNNLVAIAGLGMFIWILGANNTNPHTLDNWGSFQTFLVAGFSTIGVVAQTAILLIPVFRLRLGLRPRFGWRGVGLGQAAKLSVWTLATAAVGTAGVPLRHAHRHDPGRRTAPARTRGGPGRGGRPCPATPSWKWPASCTCSRTPSLRCRWPRCSSTG